MPPKENGTATLRDVIELQQANTAQLAKIWKEISALKVKVALICGGISASISIVSIIISIIVSKG